MASHSASQLVLDSKLHAEIEGDLTHHIVRTSKDTTGQHVRRRQIRQTWKNIKFIEKGGQGHVWLEELCAIDGQPAPKQLRAVKIVPRKTSDPKKNYNRELKAFAFFSLPKYKGLFVEFFGWYEDSRHVFIAMEYFEHGDLANCLRHPLPEKQAQEIVRQLLDGLEALHEKDFAHRDLKPQNIFVFRKAPQWWVKIGDFGISKCVDGDTDLRTDLGTPEYMAPEVLTKGSTETYNKAVDMWSLGLIAHLLLTAKLPFPDGKAICNYTQDGCFPYSDLVSHGVSEGCQDFITKRLMAPMATDRPSAFTALTHQWFKAFLPSTSDKDGSDTYQGQHSLADEQRKNSLAEGHYRTLPVLSESTQASATWSSSHSNERDVPTMMAHRSHTKDDAETRQPTQDTSMKIANGPENAIRHENYSSTPITSRKAPVVPEFTQASATWSSEHSNEHDVPTLMADQIHAKNNSKTHRPTQATSTQTLNGPENAIRHENYSSTPITSRKAPVVPEFTQASASGSTSHSNEHDVRATAVAHQLHTAKNDGTQHSTRAPPTPLDENPEAVVKQNHVNGMSKDTLISQYNLGHSHRDQGQYEEAEVIFRRVLREQERVLGPENRDTLYSAQFLGDCLHQLKRYEEAEPFLLRALQGKEKELGRNHKDTLVLVSLLGECLYQQQQYRYAEILFRRAARGREQELGFQDPETLISLASIGECLFHRQQWGEAEAMFRRALRGQEKELGPDHDQTLVSISSLGASLYEQVRYKEAEERFRQALERRERKLGHDHEDTLTSLSSLGASLSEQARYKEAEQMYRQAFQGREKTLGHDHPDTLTSLSSIGGSLCEQARYKEAEQMFRQAFQGREKTLGPDHEDTLISLCSLGASLYGQARYEEADAMFRRAIQGQEKTLGHIHEDTLTSLSSLGASLYDQGRYKEAEEMFLRAFRG